MLDNSWVERVSEAGLFTSGHMRHADRQADNEQSRHRGARCRSPQRVVAPASPARQGRFPARPAGIGVRYLSIDQPLASEGAHDECTEQTSTLADGRPGRGRIVAAKARTKKTTGAPGPTAEGLAGRRSSSADRAPHSQVSTIGAAMR